MSIDSMSSISVATSTQIDASTPLTVTPQASIPSWSVTSYDLFSDSNEADIQSISSTDADAALTRILGTIDNSNTQNNSAATQAHSLALASISSLQAVSMDSMVMMVTNLSLSVFADTATAVVAANKIITDTQTTLNEQKVKEYQEQLAAAIEQADKAKKGNIVEVVFDWIIGASETVYGATKFAEGTLRCTLGDEVGGALDIVDGAAYLTAGVAGVVKATAETASIYDPDNKKLEEMADTAGKIQLGAEAIGLALDVFQAGKAIAATRGIAQSAKVAVEAAEPELIKGVAAGSTEAITTMSQQIGQDVAKEIAADIAAKLSKTLTNTAEREGSEIARTLANVAGEDTLETALTATEATNTLSATTEEVSQIVANDAVKVTSQEMALQAAKGATPKAVESTIAITNSTKEVALNAAKNISVDIAKDAALDTTASLNSATTAATETITEAMTNNIANNIEQITQETSQAVAAEISEQVATELTTELATSTTNASSIFTSNIVKAFSQDAIAQMVTQSVKAASKKAMTFTAEEFSAQVAKEVNRAVITTALKASQSTALTTVRALSDSVKTTTSGVTDVQSAQLQQTIDELVLNQNFVDYCYSWFDQTKKQQTNTLSDLISKEVSSVSSVSQLMTQTGALHARIASAIV